MALDPWDDFTSTLTEVFESGYQMTDKEASRLAQHVTRRYFSAEDVAGGAGVWHIRLALHALCQDVVAGNIPPGDGCFVGVPVIGVLRWMQGHQHIDHVEAATCMALVQQEAEAQPYTAEDTQEALLGRVNGLLKAAAFEAVDNTRLGAAMARLKALDGLASRKGWYRLKEAWTCQKVVE